MKIEGGELGRMVAALGEQGLTGVLQVAPAEVVALQHYPQVDPGQPVLILGLHERQVAQRICSLLQLAYPAGWNVVVLDNDASHSVPLADLPATIAPEHNPPARTKREVAVLIPPLATASSLQALQEVIARLRDPDGCPWDRALTWAKLRATLLEETYELLAALDADDAGKVVEEQGDLLVQVTMQAQIAVEEGRFRMPEVIGRIVEKLIRRHPHVFGNVTVSGTQEVLANWEAIKREERQRDGAASSPLASVPAGLPALAQADAYLERMARLRAEPVSEAPWNRLAGLAPDAAVSDRLVGETLFELVAWARERGVDAESALRDVNARFAARVAAEEYK